MSRSCVSIKRHMNILVLGPHADDIELGCGATLLHLKIHLQARIFYIVFCDHFAKPSHISRKEEIEKAAAILGVNIKKDFACLAYKDTEFPNSWREIQYRVAAHLDDMKHNGHCPHLVLAPTADNHQDHVTLADAVRREVRHGQLLWHYEIKQYGYEDFKPNIFIDVSEPSGLSQTTYRDYLDPGDETYENFLQRHSWTDTLAHAKLYILRTCMKSQADRPYMDPEIVLGMMRFRSMQASPTVKYTEAFQGRLLI